MSSVEIPMFPLPNVQLFPNALLPLHVFEPRYRDLVQDCMDGGHKMAIATLEEGFEKDYDGRPSVHRVCGVGQILANEPLPDGRSNILVQGDFRARIVDELPASHAYRVVRVERLSDEFASGFDAHSTLQTLTVLANQISQRLPNGGPTLRKLIELHVDPAGLSDILAATLVTSPKDRLDLLETLDVGLRVEKVGRLLATILSQFKKQTPSN